MSISLSVLRFNCCLSQMWIPLSVLQFNCCLSQMWIPLSVLSISLYEENGLASQEQSSRFTVDEVFMHGCALFTIDFNLPEGQQLISFPFLLQFPSPVVPYGTYAQQPRKLLSLLAICPLLFAYGRQFQTPSTCMHTYYIQSVLS